MFLFFILCLTSIFSSIQGIVYDSYNGTPISNEEVIQHIKDNTTFWCINDIKPCDCNEWRRLDGSCNNLHHPTRGATHTPFYRVLPPVFSQDFEVRKSKLGTPLPLVRRLRTGLLTESQVSDQQLTVLASYFLVFVASDVTNLHDTVNYILWTPHCCTPKGKNDHMCAPIQVPDDDPVHRFTDIHCFNLTKPLTFQTSGCLRKDTLPERVHIGSLSRGLEVDQNEDNRSVYLRHVHTLQVLLTSDQVVHNYVMTATPLFDLSTVYGNILEKSLEGRQYAGGLLKYEVEDGRVWPPQQKNLSLSVCLMNRRPYETRCHNTPSDEINSLIPINILSIWFWRNHNHIATRLATINPCWDEEKLFYTARDMNIAIELQIFYYELLPMMMGYDNLVKDGVLSSSLGFRDLYNNEKPQLSMEFPIALRWLHKMQEGTLKLFDADGNFMKKVQIVDLSMRTGYLAVDNNIDYMTQGSFRQPSAKIDDHVVDPDMAQKPVGHFQRAQDCFASDMAKDRLMFIQPYIKYLDHCFGRKITSFDDLKEYFEPEVLEKLSDLYDSVEDIDLLAAMWVEKTIDSGRVPHTFYCLVVEQLLRIMQSDRHWYERPNRPHAFTKEQLLEVRKASIARLLCDVGDSVTHIQPKAFQQIGPKNEMRSCEQISEIDIMAWKDRSSG